MRKLTPAAWRAAVPPDLQRLRRWVGRDGKMPLHPVREVGAKSGQPATWGTFDEAAAFYERYADRPDRGAGFEFAAEDGLVGIDLDLALDPDGNAYPWAAELLAPFEDLGGAYVEVSPSGRGLHLITRAQLPRNPNQIEFGGIKEGKKESHVEVYREKRYFTITGDVWHGCRDIGDGQALVQGLLDVTGLTARMATRSVEGPTHQSGREPEREDEIRSALGALNPDMDHPDWIAVGMALRVAFGSAGFRMWDDWSSLGTKYEGSGDLLWRWRSFNGSGIGLGTLIHMAQDAGWTRPPVNAIQEFREFVEPDYTDLLGEPDQIGDGFPKDDPDHIPYYVTQKGTVKSAGNVALYFSRDPEWQGRLRWNVRRGIELDGRLVDDNDITQLGEVVERALNFEAAAPIDYVRRGLVAAARKLTFDPVRDYILAEPWDGVPRIEEWIIRCGAVDTRATRMISARWLIGAAGRALMVPQPGQPPLNPKEGIKFDQVLVLEGDQGEQKSTLLRTICPPGGYFFDSHFSLTTSSGAKDFYDALGKFFIVEMQELHSLTRAESETVKTMISSQTDSYRAAYGFVTEPHPRISALSGSTNEHEWNNDLTGMRRFWPIPLWGIRLDVGYAYANRQQIWAEAAYRYMAGEVFWDDDEMAEVLAAMAADRTNAAGWVSVIEEFIHSPEVVAHGYFTPTFLARMFPFLNGVTRKDQGRVLRMLGCHDHAIHLSDRRSIRVWVLPDGPEEHGAIKALVEGHPYTVIDAEFKVLT